MRLQFDANQEYQLDTINTARLKYVRVLYEMIAHEPIYIKGELFL